MAGVISRKDSQCNTPGMFRKTCRDISTKPVRKLFRKRLDELFTVELPDDIPGRMIYKDVSAHIGMEMNLVIMLLTSTTT